MRFADLVINCLKETFHNDDVNLNVAHLRDGSLAQMPDYANELNNVCISINKAIARLMTAEKIPTKTELLTGKGDQEVYNISDITDLRKIRSVFLIKNQRTYWIGWKQINDHLIYLGYGLEGTIYITYDREIKQFTESDFDSEDDLKEKYGLNDELCNYINYFVKSELFEDVDPDRCKRYLNYFEQFVAEINKRESIPYQDGVQARYKL